MCNFSLDRTQPKDDPSFPLSLPLGFFSWLCDGSISLQQIHLSNVLLSKSHSKILYGHLCHSQMRLKVMWAVMSFLLSLFLFIFVLNAGWAAYVHINVSLGAQTGSLHCYKCENVNGWAFLLSGTPDVRGKRHRAEPWRSGLLSRRRSDGVKRELFIRGTGVEESFLIMA